MRVLVIGSTGVVGRQLVPRLVEEAHDVVTTSRSDPREPVPGPSVEHHRLDLLDHSAVVGLVRPDAIVHLATALSGPGNHLRRFDRAFAGEQSAEAVDRGAGRPISYARRFAAEMPRTTLVQIPGAGHIPMENDPAEVAATLAEFFAGSSGRSSWS